MTWSGRAATVVTADRMVTMDLTGWTAVHAADGRVAGWVAPADPDEPDVDYFEADRLPKVARRAAVLDQVTALFADPAFDPLETGEAARASGLSEAEADSCAYLALVLRQVELGGG
jgi:hypothetical protein